MLVSLIKKFRKDRRGATAVILALTMVPMIIAAGAAVDFSRISAARAQIQAAVDAAAIAGVGAYQNSQSYQNATTVAKATYAGTAQNLNHFVTIAGSTPVVNVYCSGTVAQCGTAPTTGGTPAGCADAYEYCVTVTANTTMQNSLLAIFIKSEPLNATSTASTPYPQTSTISATNFPYVSIGYGSDLSGIYAYAVPEDDNGNPLYGQVPAPNTNCNSTTLGPIYYEPFKAAPAAGVTTCNFLLIGLSTGGKGAGSLTFDKENPIAFAFVNFTGGTITSPNSSDLDTSISTSSSSPQNQSSTINGQTKFVQVTPGYCNGTTAPPSGNPKAVCTNYTNELYVKNGTSVTYYPNGYTAGVVTCTAGQKNCTASAGTQLFAYCPAHNLYGSITAYPNLTNNIVPLVDSINTYTSSYMYLGYSPTHGTNHVLTPFLGPANSLTVAGTTYSVQAVCPQWLQDGTNISTLNGGADATVAFNPGISGYPAENVNVYSTYYPDKTYDDASAAIYPPSITACTPVMSAPLAPGSTVSATPNASTSNPWWGWSPSNAAAYDPGNTTVHNCAFNAVSSGGTMTTVNEISSPNSAPFTSAYSNCALLIQPLGLNPTGIPDYYTYIANPGAAPGSLGNAANITTFTPVYSKTLPTSRTITSQGGGLWLVKEAPANQVDGRPPADTSHQCYNPANNGVDAGDPAQVPAVDFPNNDTVGGAPNDVVQNAGLGALRCDKTQPLSYALYWNDMGSYANPMQDNDDLGYANAISEFTCSSPQNSTGDGSGPASLSN